MNRCIISGEVSSYGPRIQWTESGKPQTSLTLVLDKAGYKTFIPCLIVGTKAEEVAETINGGDYLIVEGSLSWKAGRTKEQSTLQVVAFGVERLTCARAEGATEPNPMSEELALPINDVEPSKTKKGKPRYPRWRPEPAQPN